MPHALLRAAQRSRAGFFSSAKTFFLPTGSRIDPGGLGGYAIDLTVKADSPVYPAKWDEDPSRILHVWIIQRGLGCIERHLAGDGDEYLTAAVDIGRRLLASQIRGGPLDGGWPHARRFPHTFPLTPGWLSGIAQGQGASLLVRLHAATGDERFADGARRALAPLRVPVRSGGLLTTLDGHDFYEEYPTRPASYVLNGAIFAVLGYRDVAVGCGDGDARVRHREGLDMLEACLRRWDTGHWSRYDLYPHPTVNVASSFYHSLHVNQLRALELLEHRPGIATGLERFAAYAASPGRRRRAFVQKSVFRVLVPRNALSLHPPLRRSAIADAA